MIDLKGTISVAEAAKRLDKSIEQVRRDLREGKLRGQRVGNQWFVEESDVQGKSGATEPLIPPDLFKRIDDLRERIFKRNGHTFDVVEMIHESREGH